MKVIDLLNKIANGEEVPSKIHYGFDDYKLINYGGKTKFYQCLTEPYKVFNVKTDCLNDEVEIIEEEKKIPEKLGYFDLTKDKNEKDENGNDLELHYTGVADTFDDVYEKINEIIDYLDYLKSKGDE